MTHEKRNSCNSSCTNQVSHMSRRTLLEKALQIGTIGSGAAGIASLLSSCNDTTSSRNIGSTTTQSPSNATIEITWLSENDYTLNSLYTVLKDTYNSINKDHINVTLKPGPGNSGDQYQEVISHFTSGKPTGFPEVISMDITWTDEFAKKGYVIPLDELWDPKERQNYLSLPLQAATFNDKLYAAPFRTDIGLLYYRDLLQTPPQTWDELTTLAQQAQQTRQTQYGYIWQGKQYEGLLCNFIEVLHGYGVTLLDQQGEVVIDSDKATQALSQMVSWVGGISPKNLLTFQEKEALGSWQSADALFMRNWPYAIPLSNAADQSKVAGKFHIAPLPQGSCCIGGWQLGINAFASREKQDAAWKFIHWMLQEDAQFALAYVASLAVTLKRIYHDPPYVNYMKQRNPFYSQLEQILEQHGILRPRSVNYQAFSSTVQKYVHMALSGQLSVPQALEGMQHDLPPILKGSSRPKP